jgi:hypothetical protein
MHCQRWRERPHLPLRGRKLVGCIGWLSPDVDHRVKGLIGDDRARLQAPEKVVLGHHLDVLSLVLESECLGSLASRDHARS